MINFDLQNHKPLREIVYGELKRQILIGEIVPGTRMMEVELADEMGVSRTPVREAIRKLEIEGLVTIEPRRGAYASDISVKDMLDVLEVREDMEALAAALTARRITEEEIDEMEAANEEYNKAIHSGSTDEIIKSDEKFHKTIVNITGNKTLVSMIETIQELATRFRYLYYDDFTRYENMPAEHEAIIQAIKTGDEEMARQVAKDHVNRLKQFVVKSGEDKFGGR
ncbi:MAG: GntR family transcriptional regulator [Clostridia bacterium]|nr:GntR family transcriptional regulator [Clostridia bacterium]